MSTLAAILALADGTLFRGTAIGAIGQTVGEVVFNTAMTGYQEIITDPSYARQLVTLTYPHIGNVGVNVHDTESQRIFASGLIVRDLPLYHSNFRAETSLSAYLQYHNVVAIAGIDTRKLTRIVRERGTQAGCIIAGSADEALALSLAQCADSMAGQDLAQVVSCRERYQWNEREWRLGGERKAVESRYHVVAYDFGVKFNILRMLAERGCQLTVVPAQTPASEVLALNPDGVFLSNGPGDPEPCTYAVQAIQQILATHLPVFGICLGHQLLGLAMGGRTSKMKFGHHGANHPVQEVASGRVMITSQNHGFQLDEASLPAHVCVTHRSLFDGTVQGISVRDRPAFGFQGHPEASPGPHDATGLFDQFVAAMAARNGH